MKKLLMIDCQVFQTGAWHRGMGKYSLELLRSLLEDATFKQSRRVVLLLNQNLAMDEAMMTTLQSVLPEAEIVEINLRYRKNSNYLPAILKQNKAYIDRYIEEHYAQYEIEFLILSLFLVEGATSFPTNSKKMILMYDLIMLQFFEMYLGLGPSDQHFGHYRTLFEADLYLTISETVANDLVTLLGIDRQRIVSIDGGPIERDSAKGTKPERAPERPFILMPTGGDFRKNNYRGVRGFEMFNAQHDYKYQLVLTSTFAESIVHDLNRISPNLFFTGNVSESELAWYYTQSQGVLFPSEYEGLGLPILEAVDFEQPVAASDISVFREISKDAFYYFDPYNVPELSHSLELMTARSEWSKKQALYEGIHDKYSWSRTTKLMANAIARPDSTEIKSQVPKKAIVAPNIMIDSLLGRFIANSFDDENRRWQVSYYYDLGVKPRPVRPNHLAFAAATSELAYFGTTEYQDYAEVEYHLGNTSGSIHTLVKALALPGVIYLHCPHFAGLYQLAAAEGYITPERLAAEQVLADRHDDKSWLVSILRSAKKVATYDSSIFKHAKSVARKAGIDTDIQLMSFPDLSLPYAVPKSRQTQRTVGLFVGSDIEAARVALANAAARWADQAVAFRVFLYGIREVKYYELLGLEFPNFVPHGGSSDYQLETFMQQIDVLYSYGDDQETEVKYIETSATAHGVEVAKA